MKLSIIIPTYNEESYLPELLQSIKDQKYSDYEIIVADAGSTDKTREIAESFGSMVLDGGHPAVGRNSGAKMAKGEYLLFLDADVILTEDYLETALNEFAENDLGIGITQLIPISDSKKDKLLHDFANLFMRSVESIKPHGAGCYGILTTKKLHEKVNGFDESFDFGEDSDYIERMGKISSFKVLREPRLLISTRRLEKEGIKSLALIYAKSTLYDFLGKKITAGELNYTFGHDDDKKNRIIYSVCGEGMGHAIRSAVMIEHLLTENEVIIFASDRAYSYLSQKFDNVYYIDGFNTVYDENTAKYTHTFIKGMKNLPKDFRKNIKLMYALSKEFRPNIIISDFEIYANILSKLTRTPLLSVDNIHIITQCKIDVPDKYLSERIAAEGVIRSFIVRPKEYLITTFFYPEIKNEKKVSLYPPVLREEIFNLKPVNREHILVYQTSDSNLELIPILKEIDEKFVIYGFNMDKEEGNLLFRKFNENQFFKDFESCKAVVSNGGFTLIGEAIYLKKPVFCIPVKKQFEQTINAIYIEKLFYGEFHESLTRENLEKFLSKLDTYRNSLNKFEHNGNHEIIESLDKAIEKHAKSSKNTSDYSVTNSVESNRTQ
ncbi:MAG: glycosyltransferase [Methanobacterium sp.]|uniref:MJ1255/VC2487 family glycosyltransferase n=1 Tax=Methanobacterium sp. TaxID=2164 RepID=UPI003D653393|nr:glycosyltransferase [Methanobacterium sp.]